MYNVYILCTMHVQCLYNVYTMNVCTMYIHVCTTYIHYTIYPRIKYCIWRSALVVHDVLIDNILRTA